MNYILVIYILLSSGQEIGETFTYDRLGQCEARGDVIIDAYKKRGDTDAAGWLCLPMKSGYLSDLSVSWYVKL